MNKTKNILFTLLVVAILVILGFWLFTKQSGKSVGQIFQNNATPTPVIQNSSDFDLINKQLDDTNLNQIDTEINHLSTESSGF